MDKTTEEAPVRAGLIAGSIAAITAALVSLPLHYPDDILLNSATVVAGTLAVGLAAGVAWRILANSHGHLRRFALLWGTGFTLSVLFAVAGETQMDRFVAFVLPLSSIVFAVTGLLTPLLTPSSKLRQWWPAPIAVMLAVAVGIALAGQGDEESGRLELPPRATISDLPSTPVAVYPRVK